MTSASDLIEEVSESLRGHCAIIIVGTEDGFVARYVNLEEPDAAKLLYACADAVVERIPLPSQSKN